MSGELLVGSGICPKDWDTAEFGSVKRREPDRPLTAPHGILLAKQGTSLIFQKATMAKHKDGNSSHGKMTIMLIQLEGSDSTLQEGIRTFKEALGRAMPPVPLRPQVTGSQMRALETPVAESNGELQEENDDTGVIDAVAHDGVASAKTPKDRKFPVMNFMDINLHPASGISLKEFFEEKKPSKQQETITVCLYYMCRHLKLSGVTAHHVYTCMKHLKEKTPNDLPKTIRNIANRKGYIDASNTEDLKITNPGDNFVEHELPSSGVA